jgi:hypothetical protein
MSASLLFCAAVTVVWVSHRSAVAMILFQNWGVGVPVRLPRNSTTGDKFWNPRSTETKRAIYSKEVGLCFERFEPAVPESVRGPAPGSAEYPAWSQRFRDANEVRWLWGFGYSKWAMIAQPSYDGGPPDHSLFLGYERTVVLPYWFIFSVTAAWPLWVWITRMARRSREARRRRRGLCSSCGYDLRASDGRCPECGATDRNH